MAVPKFEELMLPILKIFGDSNPKKTKELRPLMAEHFHLSQDEQKELLPSGTQTVLANRTQWAVYDLFKAQLLERVQRGVYQITPSGQNVLKSKPQTINREFLQQFDSFTSWMKQSTGVKDTVEQPSGSVEEIQTDLTLNEQIEKVHGNLKAELIAEISKIVMDISPYRFEHIVVDLLLAMGYGGSRLEAAKVTRASNDGGIDGVINEDRLGLDVVYVQAKRYKDPVPISHVRDFAGALLGKRARKGVFITTSSYPKSAYEYVSNIDQKIILIDGVRLANLMAEHNIGVSVVETYQVKRVDHDYFEEE